MDDVRTDLRIDLRRAFVLLRTAPPPEPAPRCPLLDPWWHQLDGLSPSEIRAVARLVPNQQAG